MDILVRREAPADHDRVGAVVRDAFDRAEEAALVGRLRSCRNVLSLVAVVQADVVGHAMFSPVTVHGTPFGESARGLAPVSVLPRTQRRGVGSQLIDFGLRELRREDVDLVVVLGDPAYYRRFGFVLGSTLGLRCKWGGEDGAFQGLELVRGAANRYRGLIDYLSVFDETER